MYRISLLVLAAVLAACSLFSAPSASAQALEGPKSPVLKARTDKAVNDLKVAIAGFDDSKAEFPKLAEQIEMARVQMIFFDNALSASQRSKKQLTIVATTSERVLSEMDAMTAEIIKQLASRSVQGATARK